MDASDIIKYYRSRFQIEFLYCDGKQHNGLEHSLARSENKLHFNFNTAPTSINTANVCHWINLPKKERETIYRRKNLTKTGLREYIRPYLLRGLEITHANQVWSTDITYIPMRKGFMYLTAILDVYNRKILSWGISNSMDAQWCKNVLDDAISKYGVPEIINSDQGSLYTSALLTQHLEKLNIKISMDGKGRAIDNIWIERFRKSIKHDYIYLNPCAGGFELFEGVQNYIEYYNKKIHQATKQKPNLRYQVSLEKIAA